MQLYIPPLRERKEDIVPLALEILQQFNRELEKALPGLLRPPPICWAQYPWPGNIRELRNVIERTMILNRKAKLTPDHLPEEIRDQHPGKEASEAFSEDDISPTGDQFLTLRARGRQLYRPCPGGHRQQQDASRADSRHSPHFVATAAQRKASGLETARVDLSTHPPRH